MTSARSDRLVFCQQNDSGLAEKQLPRDFTRTRLECRGFQANTEIGVFNNGRCSGPSGGRTNRIDRSGFSRIRGAYPRIPAEQLKSARTLPFRWRPGKFTAAHPISLPAPSAREPRALLHIPSSRLRSTDRVRPLRRGRPGRWNRRNTYSPTWDRDRCRRS